MRNASLQPGVTPHEEYDVETEQGGISQLARDFIKALENNDPELLSKLVSHSRENVFYGTDVAEYWVGFDHFMEAHRKFFASLDKTSRITMHDEKHTIGASGGAAWSLFRIDWTGSAHGEPFNLPGLRVTLIYERHNGKWDIVHSHISVPVAGQTIGY